MICSNPECKREFLPKRSDSRHCSLYCIKRNKFLKRKDHYTEYQKQYRKEKFEERKEFNSIRKKIFYQQNKEILLKKNKLYNKKNQDRIKITRKKYREKNKDIINLKAKEYRILNKDRINKQISEWQKNNRDKCRAKGAKRRAIELKAVPKFANLNKIKEIYKNCPKGYEVDHIIPLQGKTVCGLHIETNLQYLSIKANRSKGNKLIQINN